MTDVALGGQEQALPESVRRNPVEVPVMYGARSFFAIWSASLGAGTIAHELLGKRLCAAVCSPESDTIKYPLSFETLPPSDLGSLKERDLPRSSASPSS